MLVSVALHSFLEGLRFFVGTNVGNGGTVVVILSNNYGRQSSRLLLLVSCLELDEKRTQDRSYNNTNNDDPGLFCLVMVVVRRNDIVL
jgi:hypothetical protein